MSEVQITLATKEDLPVLASFISSNTAKRISPEELQHWYFRNPTGSASVCIGWHDSQIIGMATTNDHFFSSGVREVLVAMPQRVLTDPAWRGRGVFNKLYWRSEEECLRRCVSFFLTVTNEASTPIFLGKFGYQRCKIPKAFYLPPIVPFSKTRSSPEGTIGGEQDLPVDRTWRMLKDRDHYRWRFEELPDPSHLILPIVHAGRYQGDLYLKRFRKKGLPFMLLLDMVPIDREAVPLLLNHARREAFKNGCVGLLALSTGVLRDAIAGKWSVTLSSNFNLLVKGKDPNETSELAHMDFDLCFGDLDFL